MGHEIRRRDLIRGRFAPAAELPRPPYAIPEADFLTQCNQCCDCASACSTGVIEKDSDGFPILRFGYAKCTFCGACAEVCKTGSLSFETARAWTINAYIKDSCLSFNAITCRACEEACEAGAIKFQLMTGGRALALVDESKCTGCGNCAAICPNQSIEMRSRKAEEIAA